MGYLVLKNIYQLYVRSQKTIVKECNVTKSRTLNLGNASTKVARPILSQFPNAHAL